MIRDPPFTSWNATSGKFGPSRCNFHRAVPEATAGNDGFGLKASPLLRLDALVPQLAILVGWA